MNPKSLRRGICIPLACVCVLGSPLIAIAQTTPDSLQRAATSSVATDSTQVQSSAPSTNFFSDLIQDFRRLPSQDSLKWLGIGAALAAAGHSVDSPVSRGLSTSPVLDNVFDSGETIGGARLQMGGALAAYTIGRITRSPKVTVVGADLIQAQIMSQVLTGAVKMAVRRERPDGTQYSFPSGHSSVTFATATVLQRHLGWKVGIPAYAVATYVATSRIQEKRHFLSDVAFGATIGIIAGRTVTIGRGDKQFAVAPMAAPGGGGVSFTWVGQH